MQFYHITYPLFDAVLDSVFLQWLFYVALYLYGHDIVIAQHLLLISPNYSISL